MQERKYLWGLLESHVAWKSLEKAFKASTVKLYLAASAEPISVGVRPDGLTYRNFEDGSTHSVLVERAQGKFGPLFSIMDPNNPNLSGYSQRVQPYLAGLVQLAAC